MLCVAAGISNALCFVYVDIAWYSKGIQLVTYQWIRL